MELRLITEQYFDYFYSLLEQDFCFEERRSKNDLLQVFKTCDNFYPNFIYYNNQIIGYFNYWDFNDFIFGEHFAIIKEYRNIGNGTQFLKNYLKTLNKPFIFEVERTHDKNSKRRIKFYKRANIIINRYNYHQPSYHGSDDKVPMYIASYPTKISHKEYLNYTQIILENVYLINKNKKD